MKLTRQTIRRLVIVSSLTITFNANAISFSAFLPQADFKTISKSFTKERIESSFVDRIILKATREIRVPPQRVLSIKSTDTPSGLSINLQNRQEMAARLFCFDRSAIGEGISATLLNERLSLLQKTTPKIGEFEIIEPASNIENSEAPYFLDRQSLQIKYAYNRVNLDDSLTRVERSEFWVLNNDLYYVVILEAPVRDFAMFESTIRSALQAFYFVGS